MKDFDKYLKEKLSEENFTVPDNVSERIDSVLASLPEKKQQKGYVCIIRQVAVAAACFIFIALFLMPNISTAYASAVENVPVIGTLVRVMTIRNYFYDDGRHEMNIDVPRIENEDSQAAEFINKDVNELTSALVNEFYKEMEISGGSSYGSIYVDYEILTNTEKWFTLRISVNETAASSNSYFKHYHIDKENGVIVKFGDMFREGYSEVIAEDIRAQMKNNMDKDRQAIYWIYDGESENSALEINAQQNFYFNENGNMVVVFDKYEVAPGYMGCPEFIIADDVIKELLKEKYAYIAE